MNSREQVRVLLIGLGGLGCPTALMLVRAGVGHLRILEDDVVERSNLHRQILFEPRDVGEPKLIAGLRAIKAACPDSPTCLDPISTRLLPDNARQLVRDADVVIEGSDNFATKFLCCDACVIEDKPCVQGAAVRWVATAMSSGGKGRPCYRCLFEDLPALDQAPNCAEAGVVGSVVGMGAALMVELALRIIEGKPDFGWIYSYDGKRDALRRHPLFARAGCRVCGMSRQITDVDWSTYDSEACSAELEGVS